ncbi:Rad9/Ddc1 [Cokeromyces recurvatus]|uniref:Rad9/Ddc1 n=1 Tax=Cokeromyces recurvatus TaxID=90255 RepID=UPI00222100B1|nr:Rad9/Ddc1 [Cokeromyces recurvatus]KAI7901145.1 Rad9/Ddc1 [Cokeromyces recurvatus]
MEFRAKLNSEYFKLFSSTLDAFSHLGEIISIEIHNEQFVMSTINSSRTAQAVAHISRDFFKDYALLRRGSTETILRCTVSNKNFNSIFKKNLAASKLIRECQIQITQGSSDEQTHVEARIYMKLIYQNGVTKKNTLWYYDGDPITIFFEREYPNQIICHSLTLKGYLSRFDPRITEISIICTPGKVILQSHWDETSTDERPVRATFSINASDFESYSIHRPTKLTFNLREFKAIVDYMDTIEGAVKLNFDDMGSPILCKYAFENKLLVFIALQTLPRHLSVGGNGDSHNGNSHVNASEDESSFLTYSTAD